MESSTANTLISDHILKALCNTLLHSLWQGILLAVITGAIIIFTKKTMAAHRYNLLIGAMTLFACGVTITFIWQLQNSPVNTIAHQNYTPGNQAAVTYTAGAAISRAVPLSPKADVPIAQQADTGNITETVTSYLNTHYNLIILIWFLIICAKSVQMAVGLHGVFHLRRSKVFAVSKDWQERLLQLATQLRVKQTICLLESGIAKVPMVIGHLKPVILIPIGLINSLSTDEVEAILIHELAHIRRRDYLVNLLQSFMEIVFFFNPAVLWISQLIKTERENCCDDLAIAQSRNKENYIRALVLCQEYQAAGPAYAMAFPGSKNTLLDRVKRMVGNRNHSLNMFEKTVLTVCLVALGLGVSAFTAREDIKKAVKSIAAVIHHEAAVQKVKTVQNDTTKNKKPTPANDIKGSLGQLQQLSADTSKTTGSQAMDAMIHNTDSLKVDNSPVSGRNGNLPGFRAGFGTPDTSWKSRNKSVFRSFHDIGMELYRERLLTDTTHMDISLNERELIVNGVRMPEGVHARIYNQFGRKGERGNYSGGYTNAYIPSGATEPPPIIVPDFGDTLVKYGVIKDKRHIHATFNNQGLFINGVKQPDDVFQMLFKKYGENTNITYTNNGLPDTRMEQNAYWAGQQRKIIDQMQREGLINNRKDLSFTLTGKTFVINGMVQSGDVFERYRHEYVPADAGDDWAWNYPGPPGYYAAYANGYRNSEAYYRQNGAERQRVEAERDKKLVADLLQDGLITDPNNVTFTLSNKKLEINGKKQSAELYQKYKEKYVPNDSGGDWSWTYSNHK
jgi:bla regulator protein BlaR1